MKNKKLFAILTLVCFMFTLMPVAAFAAEGGVLVNGKDSVKLTTDDTLTLTTTTGANYGYTVYYAVDKNDKGVAVVETEGSSATMNLKTEGDYKVYAIGMTEKNTKVSEIVNSIDTPAKKVETLSAWAKGLGYVLDDYAKVKVVAGDYDYKLQLTKSDLDIAANNGFNTGDGEMTVQLVKKLRSETTWTDSNTTPVKNAELKFETIGYVDVTTPDGTKTNSSGKVNFRATSGTTGTWTIIVSYANAEDLELKVTASSGKVENVSVYSTATTPKNIKSAIENAKVDFKFTDASGVALDVTNINDLTKITVVSQPKDSSMKGEDFKLIEAKDSGAKVGKGVYRLAGNGTTYFEEEGTYEIKVALENGKFATAKVTLAKQGDIVKIMFANPTKAVAYNATEGKTDVAQGVNLAGIYGVIAVDANGVTASVTPEYGYSGKAVTKFDSSKGLALLNPKEEFIGSTITVYAVYKNFTASTEVAVIDGAAGVKYESTDAKVATNNVLCANIIDSKGTVVKDAKLASGNPVKVIVLEKPANAVVSASPNQTLNTKGQVELNLLASTAGEYKIQTIVTLDGGKMISGTETIAVGGSAATFKDVVVMSIGAAKIVVNNEVKDIPAPAVIKDSRTMVPIRALAEAFGATVTWDEATQSVTIELGGTKVVMTVGDVAYTVNGVAKTADVAPYLNVEASTTMVPVSFVSNAFGITPTAIAGADGAIVDVLFAK